MIIPAVTLLSIDHWAKKATPITVRMEEIKRNIWSGFTPQMETTTTETKVAKRKSMYFFTNCTRALGKRALCPKRFTKESAKRLRIKNKIKVTTVAMICGYLSNTKSNIINIYCLIQLLFFPSLWIRGIIYYLLGSLYFLFDIEDDFFDD